MDQCNTLTEQTLLDLGILTKEKIRKYPLKYTNLQAILKVYAINNNIPFRLYIYKCAGIATEYYLTDYGLEYIYSFFRSKSLDYVRSIFGFLFTYGTEENLKHPETYSFFNNFRGTTGVRNKLGSKTPAMVVHTVNKAKRIYNFNSIAEARAQLKIWFTQYPVDQFEIYRLRFDKHGCKYKEKIKLIVTQNTNLNNYNMQRRAV